MPKLAGPRDVLLLVVARAGDAAVQVAGVDAATGAWVRLVGPGGTHALPLDLLTLADGGRAAALDTVRLAGVSPLPRPPFVEDVLPDLATPPARVAALEERARSRTFAELAAPHLDTLLPAGKRVLTPKDFQPGGRQRSLVLLRPDQFGAIHLAWEGEDVRVGVSFRHRGQAYGGPTGLECTDLRLRAFARETLKRAGSVSLALGAKALAGRFPNARFFLSLGLVEGAEGTFWPQVVGFHPTRDYPATINYDRL